MFSATTCISIESSEISLLLPPERAVIHLAFLVALRQTDEHPFSQSTRPQREPELAHDG